MTPVQFRHELEAMVARWKAEHAALMLRAGVPAFSLNFTIIDEDETEKAHQMPEENTNGA